MLVSFGNGGGNLCLLSPGLMADLLGFVDTLQVLGPPQYTTGSELISYTEHAAMPSMHLHEPF